MFVALSLACVSFIDLNKGAPASKKCSHELTSRCSQPRITGGKEMCMGCWRQHKADLKKAGCKYYNAYSFCRLIVPKSHISQGHFHQTHHGQESPAMTLLYSYVGFSVVGLAALVQLYMLCSLSSHDEAKEIAPGAKVTARTRDILRKRAKKQQSSGPARSNELRRRGAATHVVDVEAQKGAM